MIHPLMTCAECGGDVEMMAKSGRTRDYGHGRILPIPNNIELPTCVQCGEEYWGPEDSARVDAILNPWSFDRAVQDLVDQKLEVMVTRVMMDLKLLPKHGLTPREGERECAYVWCFGASIFCMPKLFAYGRTVEEAHANFRRLAAGDPVEAGLRANSF